VLPSRLECGRLTLRQKLFAPTIKIKSKENVSVEIERVSGQLPLRQRPDDTGGGSISAFVQDSTYLTR